MALPTLSLPPTLAIAVSPFYTAPSFTNIPYCSIPATSLNTTRIATLTSLPVSDCGTCISLCLSNKGTPTSLAQGVTESCIDVLLVGSNDIHSIADDNSQSPLNVTSTTTSAGAVVTLTPAAGNPDKSVATFEIGPTNPLIQAWDPLNGVIKTSVSVVEQEKCKGVWDGTVLLDGSLPLGRFAEYMLLGLVGAGGGNAVVESDPDGFVNSNTGDADTGGVSSTGTSNSGSALKRREGGNLSTELFEAAVAAAAAAPVDEYEEFPVDTAAGDEDEDEEYFDVMKKPKGGKLGIYSQHDDVLEPREKGNPKPKGHGRPILPAEGGNALGKRSNITDIKPTMTGPVFSPPTGAEYMVDTGFLERQGGAGGRRFGG